MKLLVPYHTFTSKSASGGTPTKNLRSTSQDKIMLSCVTLARLFKVSELQVDILLTGVGHRASRRIRDQHTQAAEHGV